MSGLAWDEARRVVWQAGARRPLRAETVPIARADGRRLAASVHALVDLPTADVSAMDGWAVAGQGPWRIDGAVVMGAPPAELLPAGMARAITTGAAVPPGTLGILRSEHGASLPGAPGLLHSEQARPIDEGRDIRRRGEELRLGEPLIRAGARLTPPRLALAAVAGHDTVEVRSVPCVEIVVTGDEVVPAGMPRPGSVRDAFGPSLPAVLDRFGAIATTRRIPDRLEPFIELFVTGRPELFITTGGTAGGRGDLLRQAIVAEGGSVEFAGVAMRPGHPVLLARTSAGVPVLGLPGNPLAAFACLLSFFPPWLDGSSARSVGTLDEIPVDGLPEHRDGHLLTPFEWRDGAPVPSRWSGSAMLRGLADADGLLVSAAGDGRRTARILRLPW